MNADQLPDFDVVNYLTDEEFIQAYLAEAVKERNAQLWVSALNDVAHTRERWSLPTPPRPSDEAEIARTTTIVLNAQPREVTLPKRSLMQT